MCFCEQSRTAMVKTTFRLETMTQRTQSWYANNRIVVSRPWNIEAGNKDLEMSGGVMICFRRFADRFVEARHWRGYCMMAATNEDQPLIERNQGRTVLLCRIWKRCFSVSSWSKTWAARLSILASRKESLDKVKDTYAYILCYGDAQT